MPEPSFGVVTPLMAILHYLFHSCYSTSTIVISVQFMGNVWSQVPWVWHFNISCRHCFSHWKILLSRSHWRGEHSTYSHIAIPARLLQAQRVTLMIQYSVCCIHNCLIKTGPCHALCVLCVSSDTIYHRDNISEQCVTYLTVMCKHLKTYVA